MCERGGGRRKERGERGREKEIEREREYCRRFQDCVSGLPYKFLMICSGITQSHLSCFVISCRNFVKLVTYDKITVVK
jgi:hypothetical protein